MSTEAPVYRCILLAVLKKNIVFYGVSGPSVGTDFILAMFKNIGFLHGFGLEEAARERTRRRLARERGGAEPSGVSMETL